MSANDRRAPQNHVIGDLFTFALFGVFLLLSLLIVVTGVEGYRSIVDTGESVANARTTIGYITGKVRSDAGSDGVAIVRYGDIDVLEMTKNYSAGPYVTAIYHVDGVLYEIFTPVEYYDFDPEFGEAMTEIAGCTIGWADDRLLAVEATTKDGRTERVHLAIRTDQEVEGG